MKPNFANAVDPIFTHVLHVLERICNNQIPDPMAERDSIRNRFREAEAKLGQRPDWELAKFGLAAWIDDVLTDAPWTGSEWWENNSLEFEYFKTHDRATVFYTKAKEAATLTNRDALEVFYLSVILGFRGLYRDPSAAFMADQLALPTSLEAWAGQTAKSIQLGQGRPTIDESRRPGNGAPPLDGKFMFLGMTMTSVILAAILAILLFLPWFTGTE